MRISDWSSDVCSSDLHAQAGRLPPGPEARAAQAAGGVPPTDPRGRKPLALHRATAAVPRDSRHERLQPLVRAVRRPSRHEGHRPGRMHFLVRGATSRSEEHTSELQSLMRISYAVFCLYKKTNNTDTRHS